MTSSNIPRTTRSPSVVSAQAADASAAPGPPPTGPFVGSQARMTMDASATIPSGTHDRSMAPSGPPIPYMILEDGTMVPGAIGGMSAADYLNALAAMDGSQWLTAEDEKSSSDSSDTDRGARRKKTTKKTLPSKVPHRSAQASSASSVSSSDEARPARADYKVGPLKPFKTKPSQKIYSHGPERYEFRTEKYKPKVGAYEGYEQGFRTPQWNVSKTRAKVCDGRDFSFASKHRPLSTPRKASLYLRNLAGAKFTKTELRDRFLQGGLEGLNRAQTAKLSHRLSKHFAYEMAHAPRDYDMLRRLVAVAIELEHQYFVKGRHDVDWSSQVDQRSLAQLQYMINCYNIGVLASKPQHAMLRDYFTQHDLKTIPSGEKLFQEYMRHMNHGLFNRPRETKVDFLTWFKLTDKATANGQLKDYYHGNKTKRDILELIYHKTAPDFRKSTKLLEKIEPALTDPRHFSDPQDYNSLYAVLSKAYSLDIEEDRNEAVHVILWSLADRGAPLRRRTLSDHLEGKTQKPPKPIQSDTSSEDGWTSGPDHDFYGAVDKKGRYLQPEDRARASKMPKPAKPEKDKTVAPRRPTGLQQSKEPTPTFPFLQPQQPQFQVPQQPVVAAPPAPAPAPAPVPVPVPPAAADNIPAAQGPADVAGEPGVAGAPDPAGAAGAAGAVGGPVYPDMDGLLAQMTALGLQHAPTKMRLEHELAMLQQRAAQYASAIAALTAKLADPTLADSDRAPLNSDLIKLNAWQLQLQTELQNTQAALTNINIQISTGMPSQAPTQPSISISPSAAQVVLPNPNQIMLGYLSLYTERPDDTPYRWLDQCQEKYGPYIKDLIKPGGPEPMPTKEEVVTAWKNIFLLPAHLPHFVLGIAKLESEGRFKPEMWWMLKEMAKDGPRVKNYAQGLIDWLTKDNLAYMQQVEAAAAPRIAASVTPENTALYDNTLASLSSAVQSHVSSAAADTPIFALAATSPTFRTVRIPGYDTPHMLKRHVDRLAQTAEAQAYEGVLQQAANQLGINTEQELNEFKEAIYLLNLDYPLLANWIVLGAFPPANRADTALMPMHTPEIAKRLKAEVLALGQQSLQHPAVLQQLLNNLMHQPNLDYTKNVALQTS